MKTTVKVQNLSTSTKMTLTFENETAKCAWLLRNSDQWVRVTASVKKKT